MANNKRVTETIILFAFAAILGAGAMKLGDTKDMTAISGNTVEDTNSVNAEQNDSGERFEVLIDDVFIPDLWTPAEKKDYGYITPEEALEFNELIQSEEYITYVSMDYSSVEDMERQIYEATSKQVTLGDWAEPVNAQVLFELSAEKRYLTVKSGAREGDVFTLILTPDLENDINKWMLKDCYYRPDYVVRIKKEGDKYCFLSCETDFESALVAPKSPIVNAKGVYDLCLYAPEEELPENADYTAIVVDNGKEVWTIAGENATNTQSYGKFVGIEKVVAAPMTVMDLESFLVFANYEEPSGNIITKMRFYIQNPNNSYYENLVDVSSYLEKLVDIKTMTDEEIADTVRDHNILNYYVCDRFDRAKKSKLTANEADHLAYTNLSLYIPGAFIAGDERYNIAAVTHDYVTWQDFIRKYEIDVDKLQISEDDYMGFCVNVTLEDGDLYDGCGLVIYPLTHNRILSMAHDVYVIYNGH